MSSDRPTPPFRRAEIIAVGSELLGATRLDTNSLHITARLNEFGIEVRAKAAVGDDREDLATLFRAALARADLVIMTGGLGPTDDDLTREVVAAVLGLPLDEDAALVARIRQRFERRGWTMPEINRRQAQVPRGAAVLPNPKGTAPGLWIDAGGKAVLLLPGPPREMKSMLDEALATRVAARVGPSRIHRAVVRVTGRSESHVEESLQPVYERWRQEGRGIAATILAAPGQIELHLSLRADDPGAGRQRIDAAVREAAQALGRHVFSTEGRSLEEVVGELLRTRGLRIAVAESCTGGLVTSRLTDVPGSSDYVAMSIVTYSNESKTAWLGVPEAVLRAHGAVSEAVAEAMARGVRERASVDVGVGITGIAGPGGGSEQKPVGTVAIAVTTAERTVVRTVRLPGDRLQVKFQAAQAALDLLRRQLEKAG